MIACSRNMERGMLSQNDIRLSQLALAEKFIVPEQLQELFRMPQIRGALKQGVPLLFLLKELGRITLTQFEQLLARHILVRCASCYEKMLFVGPTLQEGESCPRCGGDLQMITPSAFNQTPGSGNAGTMSQNDIRLGQLAILKKIITPEQFQEFFKAPDIRAGLSRGISLLYLLRDFSRITQAQFEALLASHIFVRCRVCHLKSQIVGPTLPQGYSCDFCEGELEIITPSAFNQTPSNGVLKSATASPSRVAPKKETEGLSRKVEQDELLGKVIGGCQVLKKIGQGGMGSVYLGEHLGLKNKVALKFIPPNSVNPELVTRFYQEARSLARIDHPNVVRVQDVGESNGRYYLVMQYIDGSTLENEIQKKGKIHWIRATKIFRSVASGLEAAHHEKIVHCDVKPENIMIPAKGDPKVTDFGLAQDIHGPTETASGKIIGTSYFMSPEQCNGLTVDLRSDIYSLGVSYYYALTGQKPFTGYSLTEIMMKHLHETPVSLLQLVPALPSRLDTILKKMMAKEPTQRYHSMEQVIKELTSLLLKKNSDTQPLSMASTQSFPMPLPPRLNTTVSSFVSAPLATPIDSAFNLSDSVALPISQHVISWVQDLKSSEASVREKAANELGKLGREAEVAVLALIRTLKDENKNVRKGVVKSLTQLAKEHSPILETLRDGIEDENWVIRAHLAEVFGGVGAEVVPTLIQMLKDEHWLVRANAAEALSGIGREAKEAIPVLITALKGNDWALRKAATQALIGIGEEAATALILLLRETDTELTQHIQQAIKEMGQEGISAICAALAKEEDSVVFQLLDILKALGEDAQEVLPFLLSRVEKASSTLLSKLTESIQKISGKSLAELLPQPMPASQELSSQELNPENAFAEKEIQEILDNLEEEEQLAHIRRETQKIKLREEKQAFVARSSEELSKIFGAFQETDTPDASEFASDTFIVRADQELNRLIGSLQDNEVPTTSPSVLLAPIEDVSDILPENVALLVEELKDEDEDVQLHALESLNRCKAEAIGAIPTIIEVLQSEKRTLRDKAVEVLVHFGKIDSFSVLPRFIQALKHSNWVVRTHIAKVLAKLGPQAKDAIPALLENLQDSHWVIRKQAIEALGEMRDEASSTIPFLEKALEDADSFVRKEAQNALNKIRRF